MKLEVGQYVRTITGYIAKIINYTYVDDIDGLGHSNWALDKKCELSDFKDSVELSSYLYISDYDAEEDDKPFIKKASFNLIDLIEVGDCVNGERVGASRYGLYVGFDEMEEPFMLEDIKIYEVLTHEQYEANCYKVVE